MILSLLQNTLPGYFVFILVDIDLLVLNLEENDGQIKFDQKTSFELGVLVICKSTHTENETHNSWKIKIAKCNTL
jgi:hypothetical protein